MSNGHPTLESDANSDDAPVDEDTVRARAYEISQADDAGSPEENWLRAETELRSSGDGSEAPPT